MKKIYSFLCLLSVLIVFQTTLLAQPLKLLKDINESPWWSTTAGPRNMIVANNLLFFRQDTALWRTDGTAGGTIFLKRITPDQMTVANGIVFFTGNDGSGHLSWKTDGTPEGTVPADYFGTENKTNVNGTYFFGRNDASTGYELWKSDGTEAGTVLVKDITPGTTGTSIGNLIDVAGILFFNAGADLWKSDGTEAGTVLVRSNTPLMHPYAVPGGSFYFINNGNELWKSDGTAGGTVAIKQISTEILQPYHTVNFAFANGLLFFIGSTGTANAAVWKSDGTAAGTGLLIDISPGFDAIGQLLGVGNTLYFTAEDGTDWRALWKSDGSVAGTVKLKSNNPTTLVDVNGTLYFSADDGVHGQEPWKSDGTEAGTVMIEDIYEGSGSSFPMITDARATEPPAGLGFAVVNNTLFFSAANGILGRELWKSNGTAGTTNIVKDLYRPNVSGNPRFFTNVNGVVYFTAYDRFSSPFLFHQDELYKTDGTLSGTGMVRDLYSLGSGLPTNLTKFKDSVFFSATDGFGTELFKSNGTYNGTIKVKDISPVNHQHANPSFLTPIGSQMFFSANDGTNGAELWKTDGSETGTVLLKNINPASGSNPANLLNANGTLFFTADDGTNGNELWKSDGSETGTVMVKNISPGSTGSDISSPVFVNGILFFAANDGTNGTELWKSDGTDAGTVIVKNINAGNNSSDPSYLTVIDGVLYFASDDGINGRELWKSDGTAAGTVIVHDIQAGPQGSDPVRLTNVNGTLFFAANDGTSGEELWKSNGSSIGTLLVKDINPGSSGSDPAALTRIGNNLMFAANDGTNGNEIWLSNGSSSGTRLVQDIEPGANGSDPTEFIEVNGKVLASVFTSYWGREAWVGDVPADIPLPVQWLEFKGMIVNNDGLLEWKTEHEENTHLFLVERSSDGRRFETIGSVTAANRPGIQHYNFTDADIVFKGVAAFHYRLKQIDLDGRFEYSNIVTLAIQSNRNFVRLYPNPARDNRLGLTVNLLQAEKISWRLVDNAGRVVRSGLLNLAAGSTALSLELPALGRGMYLLHLNGTATQEVLKFMKE